MIELTKGNILEDGAEALVNTVNTKGVMGKGVALQFKQAYPMNYKAYRKACVRGDVDIGRVFPYKTNQLNNPQWIINFPTKKHWRQPSRLEYIQKGMRSLLDMITAYGIKSVAIPPLGAGSGKLDWLEVRRIIVDAFKHLPDVRVHLYEPNVAPAADQMHVRTAKPSMTPARATLLTVFGQYAMPDLRMAKVEVQKLAYFLQVAGQPLRLDFRKAQYGPYSDTLNHVLQRLEGHFIRGYGDRSRASPIWLMGGALEQASSYIATDSAAASRCAKVGSLIEGFETPLGLELLSTIHWVATEENSLAARASDVAAHMVRRWSPRKALAFREEHVKIAWARLDEQGWLGRHANAPSV